MARTKKVLVLLLCMVVLAASGTLALAATQSDVAFADDFGGTMAEWVNPLLDGDPLTEDFGCGDWKIVNGALRQVDNASSFPYLSPKDRIWKNFTMEMKFKFLVNTAGWFGVSVRKDSGAFDARFNGCNNVLLYVNSWGGVVAMRGTPGAGNPEQIATYEGTPIANLMEYHTLKVVVKDTSYKVYVDDEIRLDFTYDRKAVNSAGYISLNTCIQRVEIDDFKMTPLSSGTTPTPTKAPTKGATPTAAAATATPEPTPEATATPEPTVDPTVEASPTVEATPTVDATATPVPEPAKGPNVPLIAGIALLGVAAIGGGTALVLTRKRK